MGKEPLLRMGQGGQLSSKSLARARRAFISPGEKIAPPAGRRQYASPIHPEAAADRPVPSSCNKSSGRRQIIILVALRNPTMLFAVGLSQFAAQLETTMLDVFNSWLTAAHIGYEAQCVMAMRMMRLAAGGSVAADEARRMVAEKVAAVADAQMAFGLAISTGTAMHQAVTKAFVPVRRRVRANCRRLSRPHR
jgi:hypothetical protein